jgi:Flp pilus assembly pilin Flp
MVDRGSRTKLHQICRDRSACQPDLKPGRAEIKGHLYRLLWFGENGQDIAEYAVMLAVILVIVVGTVQLIGSHANSIFSSVASSLES